MIQKQDAEERVYYDDMETKVTASFVAGHKKIILPVERISDVIVTHKAFSMYICFTLCLCVILIFCMAPFLPALFGFSLPIDKIWFYFIPVFCAGCIWFRFIYEHYVELYVRLDDGKDYLLRVITLGRRTILYDIADAIRSALSDYRARSEEEASRDTDSLKLRRLRSMLMQSELDMTPELQQLLKTKPQSHQTPLHFPETPCQSKQSGNS